MAAEVPSEERCQRHTEKNELCGFRVRAGGTATIILMLSPLSMQPVVGTILPNLSLHWPDELHLFHPGDSLGPGPNSILQKVLSMAGQSAPTLCMSGGSFSSNQQALAHKLPETLSMARNQPWPTLQCFLDKYWWSMGPRWAVVGLKCDLRLLPVAPSSQQTPNLNLH